MANDVSSMNEAAYGGVADSYASKYGIPLDVFRNAIRGKTAFDPMYVTSAGKGIAGLNVDPNATSINAFDVGQSLDIAAQYMKGIFTSTNNWDSATQAFITGREPGADTGQNGGASGDWKNQTPAEAKAASGKRFWEYTMGDVKAFFASSAWTVIFFVVGLLIILATVYMVVTKSSD